MSSVVSYPGIKNHVNTLFIFSWGREAFDSQPTHNLKPAEWNSHSLTDSS